jgi:hypothetical protein
MTGRAGKPSAAAAAAAAAAVETECEEGEEPGRINPASIKACFFKLSILSQNALNCEKERKPFRSEAKGIPIFLRLNNSL